MIVIDVVAPIVLIGLMRFGEGETQSGWRRKASAHRRWLEEWRQAACPTTQRPADRGTRRARQRKGRAHLRDYCMLKAGWCLQAEEDLLDRDRKHGGRGGGRLRTAFADASRSRGDRAAFGLRALPALPFSRNDYWELSELRQRINRTD